MKKNNTSKKSSVKKIVKNQEKSLEAKETIEKNVEIETNNDTKKAIVPEKNMSEIGQENYAKTVIPEKPKYDYVTVKVDGNNCSASSKGFTKEEEKAIAMTMFQMRNRFGLESKFTVELRK